MFLFPRYNNKIINTTRFVESSPPRWLDFFPLAYSLYPKNATQPKGKNYNYHVGEFLELDLCTLYLDTRRILLTGHEEK